MKPFYKTIPFVTAFALLSGTLVAVNLKKAPKVYKIGDVGPNGGIVVATGITKDQMNKRTTFAKPTDPYYTGAAKADDPLYLSGKQYYQNVSMDNVGDIETTWDYYTGEGTLIAVIDSGIEYDHEDFKRNGVSTISDKSAYFETNERTGTVTVKKASQYGYSVLSHDREDDGYGGKEWVDHGSNVSGTAAASNNGFGTVGIAPGANILALKIDFYDPSINAAIEYAVDNGADVINMSLGGFDTDEYPSGWGDYASAGTKTAFKDAIDYAYEHGVIVVAAAGNESTDCRSYPACNDHVVSVGALEPYTDKFDSEYSNYNKSGQSAATTVPVSVDITAPGSVCAPGIKDPSKSTKTLGYHFTSGTSFSSPIVAGAAALWKEKHPNGTPDQFEADLYASAYQNSEYNFTQYGHGNLDVYNLLDIDSEGLTIDKDTLKLNTASSDATVTATSNSGTVSSWVSSNTSVVTISGATGSASSTATVHVVGTGSATITVTDSNGNSKNIRVTVTNEDEELYEIFFTKQSSDGTTALSNIKDAISLGGDIIKSSICSNAFSGINGLKLGSRNYNGSVSLTLFKEIKIKSIVLTACYFTSDTSATVSINGERVSTLTSSLADYTLTFDGTATKTVAIESYKRIYIGSISIFAEKSSSKPDTKPSSKSGCGGSITATSIVLSTLSVAGITLLVLKKKKEK